MAKKIKFGTLDEAMTAGTGKNKEQREQWRKEVDFWRDKRRKAIATKNEKKKKEADNNISVLLGW